MDIIQLYRDYSITVAPDGHKHFRYGWVNISCPWCTGNLGYHLGYNLNGNYYYCWRCGGHSIVATISRITGVHKDKVKNLIEEYGGLILPFPVYTPKVIEKEPFILPTNTTALKSNHKKYLERRGYDPDQLENIWGLLGTGPYSKVDEIDYKHRIIIPFVWNYEQVSFDSRDITGKDDRRYKACPAKREQIGHKDILYGRPDKWKSTGICVEGPTDVWRLGTNGFATSGIEYTITQVRMMAKFFRKIFVIFDNEEQAQIKAKALCAELKLRGLEAIRFNIDFPDPGSMPQLEANYLVKQLIK
jgi:hypothetical protein